MNKLKFQQLQQAYFDEEALKLHKKNLKLDYLKKLAQKRSATSFA